MRARYWFIIIGLFFLLAGGIYVDREILFINNNPPLNRNNSGQSSITLKECDAIQIAFADALVPEGGTSTSANQVIENSQLEAIPRTEWSTRAGFSISISTDPEYWAGMLGSGWYLDWSVRAESKVDGLEHWQMIRVKEDCISPSVEKIQSIAAKYPGQVWIVGNEPDVIWQDNVSASIYAAIYHELYKIIKSSDPSAMIAVGGISQSTPLRLRYLNRVLETYRVHYHAQMPVDWWTVHGYVLREEKGSWGVDIPPGIEATQGELYEVVDHGSLDLFESQLITFRRWMAKNGYQDTPLALTEFGILMPSNYGFPDENIANYLEQSFSWLSQAQDEVIGYPEDGYHLVQKWAWFSISDPNYSSSNLGDLSSGKLTLIGERFRMTLMKGP